MSTVVDLFKDDGTSEMTKEQLHAAFEAFWKICPKKIGKPIARAKFIKIVTTGLTTKTRDRDSGEFVEIELSATVEELCNGMSRYADTQIDRNNGYQLKDGGKYTCHPSTWLNQGRWEDG